MIDGVCRDVIKALGDGYEASGIPTVAVDRRIRTIWPGATLAAPAYPLECAPGDNLAIHIAMERAPRGSVLVVATGGFVAGYWGEVLTAMAEAAGVAGRSTDSSGLADASCFCPGVERQNHRREARIRVRLDRLDERAVRRHDGAGAHGDGECQI